MTKVLVITSGGGHWEQMMLLTRGFEGADIVYANTLPGLAEKSGASPSYLVSDCSRNDIPGILLCVGQVLKILRRERPDIAISTGAAPGLIGLAFGKLTGVRTVWIDSVANSERLSLSGRLAGYFVDLWLTQWEHLSGPRGPSYWGSIL